MKKKEKWFYVLSGFVVTIVLVIIICFTLVLTGVVTMPREILKIKSGSLSKSYDGTALTCSTYEIVDGNVADGHTIEIICLGSQTNVGKSDNHFTVVIKDENGKIVTSNYQIIKECGQLWVYD